MRIYRHALESIFAQLPLCDLAAILPSMKKEFRPLPPVASIVPSPLLRHVTAIHITDIGGWIPLDNASPALLTQHAPNLQSLWCMLTLTPNESLVFPPQLTSLHLQLDDECDDAMINGALTALVALPSLSRLCLQLSAFERVHSVDVSLVAACRSLTDLQLETFDGRAPYLSHTHLDQIRSSLGHLHRIDVGWMNADKLARLLQPPVTARWRDISTWWADAHTGELLLRLQTLTKLDLHYHRDTAHVDFLPQLPLLTVLELDCADGLDVWCIPADALLASLVSCGRLTELSLTCAFNSAHWSALFNKLTIKKLAIRGGGIETLQCLAGAPITQSLEVLTLEELDLPTSGFLHVYNLCRLRTLNVEYCSSSHLDDATFDSLSPPTALLPALTEVRQHWRAAQECYCRERQGPSFEWMQQRLMQ